MNRFLFAEPGRHFWSWVNEQCLRLSGAPVQRLDPLKPEGSDRAFFRAVAGEQTLVAILHPSGIPGVTGENDAYVAIGRHLEGRGIPVPTVLAYDRERGFILQEDLGQRSLQDAVSTASSPQQIIELYEPVLDVLVKLQAEGRSGFREEWCYEGSRYDMQLMLERESGYFLRCFLKSYLGWTGSEGHLQREFVQLAQAASRAPADSLIHRDFQSRNLLLPRFSAPYLIDFQGARLGPAQYDVASLVIDPYVPLDRRIRKRILESYLQRLDASRMPGRDEFLLYYPVVGVHRNFQILGAFSFLGKGKGKTYFLNWIPRALEQLYSFLEDHPEWACPELHHCVSEAMERCQGPLDS